MTYDEIIKRLEELLAIPELKPNVDLIEELIEDLKKENALYTPITKIMEEFKKDLTGLYEKYK